MTTETSIATESILLVDDNPTNLKLTKYLLTSEGYRVMTAEDGLQVMTMVKRARPDLILMDVQLPGTDGLEVARQLRADPATRDLTIVALTAYAMKGDESRAREAGCDGYIAKPIDTRTFPGLIRRYLRKQGGNGPEPGPGAISSVLLVEENAVQRKLQEILLAEAGYRVTSASDGVEALAIACRDRPDLVVSDVLMPRLDGFGLCEAIRSDANLANTLVILTTSGSVQDADTALARSQGATALVHKTEDGESILESIREASSRHPADRGLEPTEGPIGHMEPLRRRFLSDAREQLRTLLRSGPEGWDRQAARRIAHRWAGTGGTLGFPQISQAALRLESLLEANHPDRSEIEATLIELKALFGHWN